MHNIIQTKRGKSEIIFTDTLQICNNRIAQLRASKLRGCKFEIKKADEGAVKFARKPHDGSYRSGDCQTPPRVK